MTNCHPDDERCGTCSMCRKLQDFFTGRMQVQAEPPEPLDLAAIKQRSIVALGIRRPVEGGYCWSLPESTALYDSARDVRPLYAEVLRLGSVLREIAADKHLADCPRLEHVDLECDCQRTVAYEAIDARTGEAVSLSE